ncbi:DNA cytosine methyltransferase [Roseiflexus sp.]
MQYRHIRAIDLFCGIGGNSWGALKAGAEIVAGFDMWEVAGRVYRANFPRTRFYPYDLTDLKESDIRSLYEDLGPIDLLLASPECTSHSLARGDKPQQEKSLNLSWCVWEFARIFQPRWIIVENVPALQQWQYYRAFLQTLREQGGYYIRQEILDASDFGVCQRRKRLYIVCDRETDPPETTPRTPEHIPVRDFIDLNGRYVYTPLYTSQRARKTIERAERAFQALGRNATFLMVYYGSGPQWQTLDVPLRTITTHDRFALVRPDGNGSHEMRMLQPDELRAAMGFPEEFDLNGCPTRTDKIRLLGNAVCPPVMQAIVETLIRDQ